MNNKIVDTLGTVALALLLGGSCLTQLQDPPAPKVLYLDCYSAEGKAMGVLQTTDPGLLKGAATEKPYIQCMDDGTYVGDLDIASP